MVSYISASYIYPVAGTPIQNGVLAMDAEGTIVDVLTPEQANSAGIEQIKHHEGLLVPGLINTHCHLELSHMKGRIPKYTGLPEFVQTVIKQRSADEYEIDVAMLSADKEMFENGIVAVADISNQLVSKMTKRGSLIHYHTFLEVMGFNPTTAGEAMQRALELKEAFRPLATSIVPHAPYSVSKPLFEELRLHGGAEMELLSIHNQETADENAFFETKSGAFLGLYAFLGLDIGFFQPSGNTSLQTFLPWLPVERKTLLVHNTFTALTDVLFAKENHPNLYWCLCPNANLYIENKLPDVNLLKDAGLKITLGTDSLASNDQLSIFAEMKTLQAHFQIPTEELLRWATWNGAEFLGLEAQFGAFEKGKRPGVNLIDFTEKDGAIVLGDWIKRLF
ncbi:amidohydrolase family protein [Pedobacter sp. MC2016-24]|uniref:amidohydrolase family protein n=1 Tax=Pedobacter sp. MC2016-24 TaxID=2780090 RepID=UPI001882764E|nr:amidohydrolase family protein [Pedobacter sp. MC2016-24]MBE9599614.1 amidohydrolase family protein [Pedobacter sp. MC2016-24]